MTANITAAPDFEGADVDGTLDSIYKKITWRLIPFLLFCYVVSYLDRINIGYAQLQMKYDTGMSDASYGLGAGIFFVGYILFEVPSNMLLQRLGAKRTLFRIMFLWGITSAAMMFVTNSIQFMVARFALGVFEAGFFPGVILYLTYWYPNKRLSRILALFMTGIALAGLLAGPVSTLIMKHLNDVHGLRGWQWLFLLEGLPSVVLAVVARIYLTDRPEQADWLSPDERITVANHIKVDRGDRDAAHSRGTGGVFRNRHVCLFSLSLFTVMCGGYAVVFWMPMMIKGFGANDIMSVGLYSMIPYAITAITMVLWSRHSDKAMERHWHFALAVFLGAAGFCLITMSKGSFPLAMLALTITAASSISALPVFWAIPSTYLRGAAAAPGIALINALATLGGLFSPWLIGVVKTLTGSQDKALFAIAALMIVGGFTMLSTARRVQ
ncbi:MFS transporter [Burkholderia stagnalis]